MIKENEEFQYIIIKEKLATFPSSNCFATNFVSSCSGANYKNIRKKHRKHTQFPYIEKFIRRETFLRSEVRGGKDNRMTSPSLLGVIPRSELKMAFSIAFKLYESILG